MGHNYRFAVAMSILLALQGCGEDLQSNVPGTPGSPACAQWPGSFFLPADLPSSLITDIAVIDSCNLILSGHYQAVPLRAPVGDADAFVSRLQIDKDGKIVESWRYVMRTSKTDSISQLQLLQDEIRFLGWTNGVLEGQSSFGKSDVVIGHIDYDGELISLAQLGDERPNRPLGLFANGQDRFTLVGNDDVYVPTNYVESWEDPWIASLSLDSEGYRLEWLRREASVEGDAYQAALLTNAGSSMTLARISTASGPAVEQKDLSGDLLWSHTLTPSRYDSLASLLLVNTDSLLALGSSYLDLGSGVNGGADLFVIELDPSTGNQRRVIQFGTHRIDWAADMVLHGQELYVVSETYPDDFSNWQVMVFKLSVAAELIEQVQVRSETSGAVMDLEIIGSQLAIAGASANTSGELKGWIEFLPLDN